MLSPSYQFRACHKCGGDMLDTSDQYGPEVFCVQCGYRYEPTARAEGDKRQALWRRQATQVATV